MALYNVGEEPDAIARKLKSFFAKIDMYYPDRQVIALHTSHKKLGEALTKLYRELGYESGEEMMTAYGYIYMKKIEIKDKETRKKELIDEFKRRYPNGSGIYSVADLSNTNPDLAKQIASAQIKKKDLIEAGIIAVNTNTPSIEEFELLCSDLLNLIHIKYPSGPVWTNKAGLISSLPEAQQMITDIQSILLKVIHRPFVEEMKERGIFAKQKQRRVTTAVSREYLERMIVLDKNDKALTAYIRQSFGLSFPDYKKKRECNMPHGTIGKALFQLKTLLPQLEEAVDENRYIVIEDISQPMQNDLMTIAETLGYSNMQTLLARYGYLIK